MTTTKHVLATTNFFQDWSDIGQITTDDNWNGVASIVGYRGDNVVGGAGTNPQLATGDGTVTIDVNANRTDAGTFTTGGVAEFQLTDPVVALQGSGTADAPHLVIYLDATGRDNIVFSFKARDIDSTADNAIQQVAVQYRVGGTGAWIDIPAGYISDATTGPSTLGPDTIRSVTLPAGANGASDLQIRIITADATGSDEWVGIDDISVTSVAIPPGPGILAIGDAAVAEGNGPGTTPITFTVNRSAGDDGAVTADYAVTFTGIAPASASDFAAGQVFTGTVSWADGDAAPKTITLQVQGDVIVEPNETFTVTLSNATGGASISDATGAGQITNDDSGPVPIYDIQGATHTSPFTGATVTTSGIVTAVDSNGFYIQDPTGDANDATSDGIFVFTSSAPTASIGQSVTVTGTVAEFVAGGTSLGVTEITSPVVVLNSSGNPLPAATVIGSGGRTPPTENYEDDNFTSFNPATDALDFYESMEGMRVTIDAPLVVADTNGFGETWVVASGGSGATGINARDGITVSEGDFNPERIQIDDDANLSPAGYDPDHSQGDVLGDVTGILNYSFSNYEVVVTGPVTVTTDVDLGQETTALDGDSTHLSVASYNVENLDPTDLQSKFDAIADQIVDNLNAPDIIGLQEVQDADGAGTGTNYSGAATAQKLIDAITAAGGPTYQYVEIAPTSNSTSNGEPNGNIRNGYLYNPARVTYVAGSEELVLGAVASGARYPLAVDFLFNGETVTVINNHFTSRGGSDPLMGDNQPPANAGDSARLTQAQAVRAYIDALVLTDPELNIVTLGDFNSYYFEAPLQALQAGGAQNNLVLLLPEEERYSYMFEGNLQPFDNILVGPNLNLTSDFDAVHLNAEQPAGTAKPTDHDPALAEILISLNDIISSTSGNDVRASGAGHDLFYLNGGGNDTASGGADDDTFYFGAAFTSADATDGGSGVDTLALQGDYSGGLTFGADDLVNDERLLLLSSTDARFGGSGPGPFDYDITTIDANVAAGLQLIVDASTLGAGEDLVFDGSAESNGKFLIFGSAEADALTAGGGADLIFGLGGNDIINGLAGNDFIDGGAGGDTLTGGGDDDTYVVDNLDSIIEIAGQGFDQVYALFSYTLEAAVSAEVLAPTASGSTNAINLFGNELGQQIFGNAGANILGGGGGTDSLYGLGGDDTYSVEQHDFVFESAGQGFDQVYVLTDYALAAGVEAEVLAVGNASSLGSIYLAGNEFGQSIFGNDGANVIDGGGGADALYGRGGDDIYSVDGNDVVVEDAGQGFDQVYSATSFTLNAGSEVEVIAAGNSASITALNLTGNAFGQQLFGNAGANTLDGAGGADSLFGNGGADSYAFSAALGGSNVDTIFDYSGIGTDGDDVILLDDAVFTGLAPGALDPNAFFAGGAAHDADDRIVYDVNTGGLYFDADGNGVGAAILFAILDGTPAITAGDFIVI